MERMRWIGVAIVVLAAAARLCAGDVEIENPFGMPENAGKSGGALVLAGGGDLQDDIYDEFVRLAGGAEARIVLIPSAYNYGNMNRIKRAFGGWREYELAEFEFLHTDDREEADLPGFAQALERATGVWIAGGGQGRIVDRYARTRVEDLLRDVLKRGGVVGGTSAGASVVSELMIRHGTFDKAVVDRGLCLARRLVIDQHFSERGRFPRLLGVLEEHPGRIGLGIDESTAVILRGNRLRVLGEGRTTVCFRPARSGAAISVQRLQSGEMAEVSLVRADEGDFACQLRRD